MAAETGLLYTVGAIAQREKVELAPISGAHIVSQHVAAELIEKSAGAQYPRVHLYCEKITNHLKEKFRTFSGTVRLVAEVRASFDRAEALEPSLMLYVDAVTDVLDSHRGDWGDGFFFTGGYEVSFSPMKHGGKNFIQSAKIVFEVNASQG
ncbi:MAG: hypothetical protein K2X03_20595 [Bryobacteraceae bacterium]|nr:hypothetical protein [Bryobacteraceae bacterium]